MLSLSAALAAVIVTDAGLDVAWRQIPLLAMIVGYLVTVSVPVLSDAITVLSLAGLVVLVSLVGDSPLWATLTYAAGCIAFGAVGVMLDRSESGEGLPLGLYFLALTVVAVAGTSLLALGQVSEAAIVIGVLFTLVSLQMLTCDSPAGGIWFVLYLAFYIAPVVAGALAVIGSAVMLTVTAVLFDIPAWSQARRNQQEMVDQMIQGNQQLAYAYGGGQGSSWSAVIDYYAVVPARSQLRLGVPFASLLLVLS